MSNTSQAHSQLQHLHRELGIPADYAASCNLPLCLEPDELVATEPDFYKRQQRLTPAAFGAWSSMRAAATEQGISLFLISAFRGYQYQCDLIAKKLQQGQCIEEILRVNAAPGYS